MRDGFEEMMGVAEAGPTFEVTLRGAGGNPVIVAATDASQNARMRRMHNLSSIASELSRTADRLTNISRYVVALSERVREVANEEAGEGHYDEISSPESEVLPPPPTPPPETQSLPSPCRETQGAVLQIRRDESWEGMQEAHAVSVREGYAARRMYERTSEASLDLQAQMTTEMWHQQLQGISQSQGSSLLTQGLEGGHSSPASIAVRQQAMQHLPGDGIRTDRRAS